MIIIIIWEGKRLYFFSTKSFYQWAISDACILRMWAYNTEVRVKVRPQWLHLWGFSPVCRRTCLDKSQLSRKSLPQKSHLYSLFRLVGFSEFQSGLSLTWNSHWTGFKRASCDWSLGQDCAFFAGVSTNARSAKTASRKRRTREASLRNESEDVSSGRMRPAKFSRKNRTENPSAGRSVWVCSAAVGPMLMMSNRAPKITVILAIESIDNWHRSRIVISSLVSLHSS